MRLDVDTKKLILFYLIVSAAMRKIKKGKKEI